MVFLYLIMLYRLFRHWCKSLDHEKIGTQWQMHVIMKRFSVGYFCFLHRCDSCGCRNFCILCLSILTPYFCITSLIQSSLGKLVALENVEDFYTSWKVWWWYYLCKATDIEDSGDGDLWPLNTPVAPKYL
jgi:hypothetical protein